MYFRVRTNYFIALLVEQKALEIVFVQRIDYYVEECGGG